MLDDADPALTSIHQHSNPPHTPPHPLHQHNPTTPPHSLHHYNHQHQPATHPTQPHHMQHHSLPTTPTAPSQLQPPPESRTPSGDCSPDSEGGIPLPGAPALGSQLDDYHVSCVGCGQRITERWFSKTQEGSWHSACLRCVECHLPLEEKCFAKHGHLYCKDDYYR